MKIQYSIHRQKIGVSSMPLDEIYNEKVDMIKKFEGRTSRDPAPIKLALMENFIKCNNDQSPNGGNHDLSLINVKCEEFEINKNHIFETSKINQKMYLSEPERKELIKRLEKASKTDTYVNQNFDKLLKNIMGCGDKFAPHKHSPRKVGFKDDFMGTLQ